MTLKVISSQAVPRALELAERYRLLNEPEQAVSICLDVLAAEPSNATARRTLFLATTEQFDRKHGSKVEEAEKIAAEMDTEYDRAYYAGVACERWARAKLQDGAHASWVGEWLRKAMHHYEAAEAIRDEGNDDPLLRWNACARLMGKVPGIEADREHEPQYGD